MQCIITCHTKYSTRKNLMYQWSISSNYGKSKTTFLIIKKNQNNKKTINSFCPPPHPQTTNQRVIYKSSLDIL